MGRCPVGHNSRNVPILFSRCISLETYQNNPLKSKMTNCAFAAHVTKVFPLDMTWALFCSRTFICCHRHFSCTMYIVFSGACELINVMVNNLFAFQNVMVSKSATPSKYSFKAYNIQQNIFLPHRKLTFTGRF